MQFEPVVLNGAGGANCLGRTAWLCAHFAQGEQDTIYSIGQLHGLYSDKPFIGRMKPAEIRLTIDTVRSKLCCTQPSMSAACLVVEARDADDILCNRTSNNAKVMPFSSGMILQPSKLVSYLQTSRLESAVSPSTSLLTAGGPLNFCFVRFLHTCMDIPRTLCAIRYPQINNVVPLKHVSPVASKQNRRPRFLASIFLGGSPLTVTVTDCHASDVALEHPPCESGCKVTKDDLRNALFEQCGLEFCDFAPDYDVEYSSPKPNRGRRGKERYFIPQAGWNKLALRVSAKYEDEQWLHKNTWPVVYHGTSADQATVLSIVRGGLKIRGGTDRARHGERFGAGIYCSPVIDKAIRYAEVPLMVHGVPYTLVFQCRVRPEVYQKHEKNAWLVQSGDDIRPCGILLRRFLLTDDQVIRYRAKNPYPHGTRDWRFYEDLRCARTVQEARRIGRNLAGLQKDHSHGRLRLQGLEERKADKNKHYPRQQKKGKKAKKYSKEKKELKEKKHMKEKRKSRRKDNTEKPVTEETGNNRDNPGNEEQKDKKEKKEKKQKKRNKRRKLTYEKEKAHTEKGEEKEKLDMTMVEMKRKRGVAASSQMKPVKAADLDFFRAVCGL